MAHNDCTATEAVWLKPVEEAIDLLLSHAKVIAETETVVCADALDRVLAAPVISCINVPPWNNNAMDGDVVSNDDARALPGHHSGKKKKLKKVLAGSMPGSRVIRR